MLNPIYEFTNNAKLIISRKRIINGISAKIQTHKDYVEMYQDRLKSLDSNDPNFVTKAKRAKLNIWRHNKDIEVLRNRIIKHEKILSKLQGVRMEAAEISQPMQSAQPQQQSNQAVRNVRGPMFTSFNSIFKPYNISGFTLKSRNLIMAQSSRFLQTINILTNQLKQKAANEQNRNAQADALKVKYCNSAYKIHHEFISKAIFWKSRVKFNMGPQFAQLKEQYTRSLFTLQQEYKREELGLDTADTSNY